MNGIWRGLTWDHPRGYRALEAAAWRASESGLSLSWDRHSLEGFEAHPISELCARYDLVVLDHPHVGEAVAADCLTPLEDLFDHEEIALWRRECIGPSLNSYRYAGTHWALPLDAASQVMARRRDVIESPPVTWDEVVALSGRKTVALSLSGPHAILTFQSICAALGAQPADHPDVFMDRAVAREAWSILSCLARTSPEALSNANPIAILEHMSANDDVALCPLVYGYVTYAPGPVAFSDAPRVTANGPIGSILGGTGIGVSRRARPSPELMDHLRWLMSAEAQSGFIPDHDGQPALRSAWRDPAVDARWGGFYSGTIQTLEQASLRPRHDGAIAFQTAASERLRRGLVGGEAADAVLDNVQTLHERHHAPGAQT
jgi:multiple sugar transport system substrate-binding protein